LRPEFSSLPNPLPTIVLGGPDPLVSMPASLNASPGERLTVPVNLDTAAGLESAELRIGYDAAAIEVVEVRRGNLTGEFQWLTRHDEPGVLQIDMSSLGVLQGGSGSILELDVRIKPTAQPGPSLIDLQWASLSDGRLTLNPAPQAGPDSTDTRLTIEGQPGSAPVRPGSDASRVLAGLTSALQPSAPNLNATSTSAPVFDWASRPRPTFPGSSPGQLDPVPGWKSQFVNKLARSDDEANPNRGIKLKLPTTARPLVSASRLGRLA